MHLKKKYKRIKLNFVVIIFITILMSIIYILKIFNDKALPIFINYSELEVNRIATLVLNNSITKEISNQITIEDLFIIKQDEKGKIISMDIDSSKSNDILVKANEVLERNFKYLEDGEIDKLKIDGLDIKSDKKGVIYELPSGVIFDNVFLNNLFPKIPVRLNLVGSVFSRLTTNIESYGINNAILKVNIQISVELKVILPFTSKNTELVTTIPLIIKILEGEVPSYYFTNT